MRSVLPILAVTVLALSFESCQCSKRILSQPQGATFADDGARINKELSLITPEQFSANIGAALGFDEPYYVNAIVNDKSVALGGIDWRTSFRRNRIPTGQSQLTIRRLAWDIAKRVVERDAHAIASHTQPRAFTIANVAVDRPFLDQDIRLPPELQYAVRDGDERYRAQLDDLYWRLLSRPPTDQEVSIMTDLFITTVANEGSALTGWQAVLYVLLASMEYWNI